MLLAALALPASARADTPGQLERRLGPQGVVDVDPATRTARVVARLDGTLTRPAAGAAATIGLRYVRANLQALGLTEADLDTLGDPILTSVDGIRQVRWRQSVNGVEAADAELRVSVTRDGRVLNVLGAPSSDLPQDTTPTRARPRPDAQLTIYDDRLAWRYTDEVAPDAIYDVIVDADTGRLLKRHNLVKSDSVDVWENHPGAEFGGARVTQSLTPWLANGSTTLNGTYVHAYSDIDSGDDADASEEVEPLTYPFQTFPGLGCAAATPCSWDGSATTRLANRQQNAVQAFYLANRFRDHLAAAPIGFDGFEGVDKLLLETSDASGTSNANMYTPPDGKSPRMQMFLWFQANSYRAMNSGDDASILYHEYAHGLTGRPVVDADGVGALNTWQAGAMGEGWGDYYAKDFLVKRFPALDGAAAGDVHMGVYTDVGLNKIRHAGLDCPVGVTAPRCPGGGYTYGDFGEIASGPQVHADGEIWAQTLWDLRTAIGVVDTERIVTQALRLSPPEPTFLDMRNAILQADAALLAGTRHDAIWQVFAARGMGFYASAIDGGDTTPVEDFSLPPEAGDPRGTISGRLTDHLLGSPVAGVTVSVGGQSAGPDALVATTDAAGQYAITGVPAREYANVVVRGPGYDPLVFEDVTVPADGTVTRNATVRRDWAARAGGAQLVTPAPGSEYSDMGCGPEAALDGMRATTWSTPKSGTKPLTVTLPTSVDVTEVGIDPTAGCLDDANSATAQYRVETAPAQAGPWTTVVQGTFGVADRNRLNVLSVTASEVRFVRLTPITTQGGSFIDISEFTVYGRRHLPLPETTLVSAPPAEDSDPTPTFAFTSSVEDGSFECRVDDAPAWTACTSGQPLATLADGDHSFEVRALNPNGEPDPTPVRHEWQINTALPDTQLSTNVPAIGTAHNVSFTFSGGTSFQCRWGAGAFAPCTSPVADTLPDGAYTFAVRAINVVGTDPSPATHAFTIDSTAPVTTVSGATVTADVATFTFTTADATAVTHRCTFDGVAAACSSPVSYSGLDDGNHTFSVTATDAAQNAGTPVTRAVAVAVPAHDTRLLAAPDALITGTDAHVAFDSPSGATTFECSFDDGAFAACSSPFSRAGLADGSHRFAVRAVGPGARRDASPAQATFTVDTTPPETILMWTPPAIVTTRDLTIGFTASEAAAYVCEVDGVRSPCTSPLRLTGLAEGAHAVVVTAIDAAGHADPTPERRDFMVVIPSLPPAPSPTPTPAPRRKALESVTVAKTASLKTLRKSGRIRFNLRAPAGATLVIDAKLGTRVIGKTSRTVRGTGATVTLTLDKKRLRAAKARTTLTLRVRGSGTGLTPATQSVKIRLKA